MNAIHGLILFRIIPPWTHQEGDDRTSQVDANSGATDGTQHETRRAVVIELLDGCTALAWLHVTDETILEELPSVMH